MISTSGFRLALTFGAFLLGLVPAVAQPQSSPELNAWVAIQNAVVDAIDTSQKSVAAFARGVADASGDKPSLASFEPHEYGTGVIIDSHGLILTNYHLLGEVSQSVYMVWHGGRTYFPAKVRAADPWTDLAVLEIDGDELTAIPFGDGSAVKKGQFVIAVGNPYEIAHRGSASATWGIISNVSAKPATSDGTVGRETAYQHGGLIQTDARLRLGSSGGPLVDLKGEMIGLVTSARALHGYDAAASYAVPVDDTFRRVVDRLKSGREAQFGFLGVDWNELTLSERQSGLRGVRLSHIYPGSPAVQHGLQSNDIVTHVDRQPVRDSSDLSRLIAAAEPGATVTISVRRTDPILRRTRAIQRSVTLSKKFVQARRPRIVTQTDQHWRGIRVEYLSAVADFRELSTRLAADGGVVVVESAPDSAGFEAGIRRGDLITHVSGRAVRTPEEFAKATENHAGAVELQLIASDGRPSVITVAVARRAD
jgi:S1-C subfamily serine protease